MAKSYPYVKEFVVMNECNTSLFTNPQYAGGKNVSAPECGAFLAAAYDALTPAVRELVDGLTALSGAYKLKQTPRAGQASDMCC